MRGMKKSVKKIFLPLFLSIALLLTSGAIIVYAGPLGTNVISSYMTEGTELPPDEWYWGSSTTGVTLDGKGTMCFDNTYKHGAPIISLTSVSVSTEIKNALDVTFTVKVNEIKGDKEKTFGFVYGLTDYLQDVGSEGSTYVYIAKLGEGYGIGVKNYNGGAERVLLPLTAVSSTVNVHLTMESDGKMHLYANNVNVYNSAEAGDTTVTGYLGFSSTSTARHDKNSNYINVEVSNLIARNEYYDKPETPRVTVANFDTKEYNTEEWYIRSSTVNNGQGVIIDDNEYTGDGQKVARADSAMGNGILRFQGSGQNSCIISRHKYSNFEFQFDVFDVKNQTTDHGDGRKNTASAWLSFSWGSAGDNCEIVAFEGYSAAKYVLYFGESMDGDTSSATFGDRTYTGVRLAAPGGVNLSRAISGVNAPEALREGYDFLNKGYDGKNVRISVKMVDGLLTVGVKHVDEIEFHEVLTYRFYDGVPTGYVCIRGEGNNNATATKDIYVRGGYYSIDNILLLNYDKNATITNNITFTGNVKNVKDYDYRDPYTDDYLITNTGGKPTGAK